MSDNDSNTRDLQACSQNSHRVAAGWTKKHAGILHTNQGSGKESQNLKWWYSDELSHSYGPRGISCQPF